MIPSRTDNESEVEQQIVVLFRFPGQGHSYWVHRFACQYQMRNISCYLPVVEFILVLLIKASEDWESGSDISIPKGSELLVN